VDTFVDYYELLHVQPAAPAAVIKASHRAMLQKLNHHPDKGGDVAFAQLLNAAAKTLCDPQARAHYDELRRQQQRKEAKESQAHSGDPGEPWGEPGGSPSAGHDKQQKAEKSTVDSSTGAAQSGTRNVDEQDTANAPPAFPAAVRCPFCKSPHSADHSYISATKGYTNHNRCRVCNAARTPIAQFPVASNDRLRRIHRQHHETPAQLWRQWPMANPSAASLTDFSPAGCALQSAFALSESDTVMLETDLFNAVCKVRYCRPSVSNKHIIGLEFLTLDLQVEPGTLLDASA